MKTAILNVLAKGRDLLCSGFSLTRAETVSLLLVIGILMVGFAVKIFLH